jgi:hypothetical protein
MLRSRSLTNYVVANPMLLGLNIEDLSKHRGEPSRSPSSNRWSDGEVASISRTENLSTRPRIFRNEEEERRAIFERVTFTTRGTLATTLTNRLPNPYFGDIFQRLFLSRGRLKCYKTIIFP